MITKIGTRKEAKVPLYGMPFIKKQKTANPSQLFNARDESRSLMPVDGAIRAIKSSVMVFDPL